MVNTIAQYSRSVISIIIALYSTRLILSALGVAEYGIYSLVAGVVAMLSFISNALVSTTQRFLSYHQGKTDLQYLSKLWGNIIILHLLFSIVLIMILEGVMPFLFNGFLNIAPDNTGAAKIVYQCSVFMVTMSFLSAPFLALLIAHENIVYSSIVQVFDAFMRLAIAIIITYYGEHKLILYVVLLCIISIFDICSYSIYAFRKYPECVIPRWHHLDNGIIKKITSFLVWTMYSTGCVVGRTQGCAIVLNRFFGTVINAAFGIAQQVSGAISFVSESLLNAINPLIIKAEGSGDRERMFDLSMAASKFGFVLLSFLVLPVVTFMPEIIKLWLGETPEYVVLFCRVILITSLCDQLTIGLITANRAIGNIRVYSLTINSIKLSTVLFLAVALWCGLDINISIWIYAVMELICAMARLPFMKYNGGLKISKYIADVFKPICVPFMLICVCYYISVLWASTICLIIIMVIISSILYASLIYKFALNKEELLIASKCINRLIKK